MCHFYDIIAKYEVIAKMHVVAIGFLILHIKCKQALQMASMKKLKIRAIIKFCKQKGDTPSITFENKSRSEPGNAPRIGIGHREVVCQK